MTAMISVIDGASLISSQRLAAAESGTTAHISAVEGGHYLLEEVEGGISAGDISAKRVGASLVLRQTMDGAAPASVVVENFYDLACRLLGVGVNGENWDYQVATENGFATVAGMRDGASSKISLLAVSSTLQSADLEHVAGGVSAFTGVLSDVVAAVGDFALGNAGSSGNSSNPKPSPIARDPEAGNEMAAASFREPVAAVGPSPAVDDVGAQGTPGLMTSIPGEKHDEHAEQVSSKGLLANPSPLMGLAAAERSVDDTPVIDAILDGQGAIQGVVESGGHTDDGRPKIVGKAETGVLVHIYRGVELIGQVTAGANGEWSFTPKLPLSDGRHAFSIVHEYPDGEVSNFSVPYVIVVDRVVPDAPTITGMQDDQGRITGAIADGMVTDDDRPTIDGTAEAHATVIVYDKGKEIGRTLVGADGSWSFTPEPGLADGLHILSYAAVDRAGNGSERTAVSEFVVDARPEKINIYYAEDDAGSVIDEVFSGGVTDDSTPTLFGTATAGGVVKIYEGSVLLGQSIADVDGTWQFTPAVALNEGRHSFHATVTLVAKGESEPSKPFKLTVDVTPPEKPSIEQVLDDVGLLQGVLQNGAITDDNKPTLLGTAEAGSKVHIYDRSNLLGSVLADATGKWTYTPDTGLADGQYGFRVAAEDAAGNQSGFSEVFEIVIASAPGATPTIDRVYDDAGSKTGNLAIGEETDDYRPDISGTAEAGSTVILKDHGIEIGRVLADAEGLWMFTPQLDLAEGTHRLTAESMGIAGNISTPSDQFDFIVAQNGDDRPRELGAAGAMKFNATIVIDTSGSMAGAPIRQVQTTLKLLAAECLGASGAQAVTLTLLTMTSNAPMKYTFSSEADADYARYVAAVNSLSANGDLGYEQTIQAAANSIKAGHLANSGPSQVFILGDGVNSLSQTTADKWQAMLLNPTGNEVLDTPILSTPISVTPFYKGYEYSLHWLATGGKAIELPSPEMLPDVLLGAVIGDGVSGNLLDNDVKLIRDGNEYLNQITFDGGLFRIAANNSLVMTNVAANVKGIYDPATGLLSVTTESGTLQVYMHASAAHQAGDYTYKSKFVQPYYGESAKEETFGYLALDTHGVSQSANLHIVLQPPDTRNLLKIDMLGKDTGLQGDFLTADGSAGREISGTLSQHLANGLKVQVSVDGGNTWSDAVTHGKHWTFIDMSAHSSSWSMQVRVSDGVTHGTQVLAQEVTLAEPSAAPVISSIPEAANIYTSALAQDGSEMTVSLAATGAKAGDNVHIQWGTSTYDQVLTTLNISNGFVILNVPASVTHSTASYNYNFSVTAQIIGQDGSIGALSAPYSVVGTYARALLSDALQLAPVDHVYTGNGFIVTTTGSLAKTVATTNSLAGLTLSDPLQANATFTLNKPADQIALRLSGAENALGAQIRVFDVSGNLLHQQTVFGDGTARHTASFTWTKSGLMDIGSFTVTAMSSSVTLDSFSQYVVTHAEDKRDQNLIDVLAETFHGSAANDVVSISQYAHTYFGQAAAAIHGGGGTDTLKIVGANHVLDLTAAGSKISSMEVIDLTGTGNNTLTLNLSDVLRNGGTNIFHAGDAARVQMMVKGNAGDRVNLGDLLTGNIDHGDWVKKTAVVIEGVTYDSFQHSSLAAELLVQQGVNVAVTNSVMVGVAEFSVEPALGALSEVLASADDEFFPWPTLAHGRGDSMLNAVDLNHAHGFGLDTQDYRLEAY